MPIDVSQLRLEDFRPLLNTTFVVVGDDRDELLVLRDCRQGKPCSGWGGREPFRLTFDCKGAQEMGQGIFRVSNDSLGEFEIFLVPSGPAVVQAVFN